LFDNTTLPVQPPFLVSHSL